MGVGGAGVRWGLFDSVLAFIAPARARQRYIARAGIALARRAYEGASKGRGTEGWRAGSTSADAEIRSAGSVLRDRMRDLVRNDALAAQAVQVLVNNIIGTGILPRSATGDAERDARINRLFAEWSAECDAHGHTDFTGLQTLAARGMIEGGDIFAIRRPLRRAQGRKVPLMLELKEADHLDDSKWAQSDRSYVSQGIEYDLASGARRAYWLYPDHPGDASRPFAGRFESVRVPDSHVAHLFERQRLQSRGVPWGAPAMKALRDLGDWQNSELVRKKIEACLVGVVLADDDGQASVAPTIEDAEGNQIEQFEPGMFAYARGGKDIKFHQPSATPGIREWNLVQMHIIASGFRVPYALLTGDLSQANFSSSRAGLNEFRRMVEQLQWQVIIPMFCKPIWAWFCEAAYAAGLIETPDIPVEWAPPKFESVNPWQDAQTDLLEVRSGFASLPMMIAKRGEDPRRVIHEQAAFMRDVVDPSGMIVDCDPRKVSRAGVVQSTDPDDLGSNGGGTTSEGKSEDA